MFILERISEKSVSSRNAAAEDDTNEIKDISWYIPCCIIRITQQKQ